MSDSVEEGLSYMAEGLNLVLKSLGLESLLTFVCKLG